jgi:hypothetical protein
MLGIRLKAVLFAAALILALAAGPGSAALATAHSVTLDGSLDTGETPDSDGFSAISVDATLANGMASGTLTTDGRTGGPENFSHNEFTGDVTCMLAKGKRIIIGAFGHASQHEEEEIFPFKETITPFPGTYMQVAVIESTDYQIGTPGGEVTVRRNYQSLGQHHEGISSSTPPNCKSWRSLEAITPADLGDSLLQPPAITRPANGATSPSGKVKFAGTGEASTSIELYEVGHESEGSEVAVNAHGKWKTTISGLSVGSHEFTAIAVEASTVRSNTVRITVG